MSDEVAPVTHHDLDDVSWRTSTVVIDPRDEALIATADVPPSTCLDPPTIGFVKPM
jgi:hypothetical protein